MSKRRFKDVEYQRIYDWIWRQWSVYSLITDMSLHTTENDEFWETLEDKFGEINESLINRIVKDMEGDVKKALKNI